MSRQRKMGINLSGAGLLTISWADLPSWNRKQPKMQHLIVTISNYSLEKIKQFYKVDEAKVRIVPNGVDAEKFQPFADREAAKQQFGLGNEPCVLFVGSLIPRKGLAFSG